MKTGTDLFYCASTKLGVTIIRRRRTIILKKHVSDPTQDSVLILGTPGVRQKYILTGMAVRHRLPTHSFTHSFCYGARKPVGDKNREPREKSCRHRRSMHIHLITFKVHIVLLYCFLFIYLKLLSRKIFCNCISLMILHMCTATYMILIYNYIKL